MTMMKFHNALRIMRSIDRYELKFSEIFLTDPQWIHFTSDPCNWFIRANDDDKKKLWTIIEHRMEETKMTITYSITVTRYVDGLDVDTIYIDGYGLISEAFSDISDMIDKKGWDDNTEQNDDK